MDKPKHYEFRKKSPAVGRAVLTRSREGNRLTWPGSVKGRARSKISLKMGTFRKFWGRAKPFWPGRAPEFFFGGTGLAGGVVTIWCHRGGHFFTAACWPRKLEFGTVKKVRCFQFLEKRSWDPVPGQGIIPSFLVKVKSHVAPHMGCLWKGICTLCQNIYTIWGKKRLWPTFTFA